MRIDAVRKTMIFEQAASPTKRALLLPTLPKLFCIYLINLIYSVPVFLLAFFLSRYFSITVRRFLRCKKIFFIVKILRCIDFLYIRCFLILIFLNYIRRNNRLVLLFVFLCNKKRFSYISLWLTHLRLPLKHNIPLPKSAGCRMYTFFLPVYEISLNLFFPFSYPMKMAIFI